MVAGNRTLVAKSVPLNTTGDFLPPQSDGLWCNVILVSILKQVVNECHQIL